jgi:dUTP pyrophosphatase
MQVRFKRLSEKAVIPTYAKPGDAGMDITAIAAIMNNRYNYFEYYTGIAVEIPEGYVGLLFPRSSVSNTNLSLANCVGVVDSGYRGEITFRYKFPADMTLATMQRYREGDRVGQLIILPYPKIELVEVDELNSSDRGDGGYGSTGK